MHAWGAPNNARIRALHKKHPGQCTDGAYKVVCMDHLRSRRDSTNTTG